jgi:hypothetical protein
MDAVGINLSAYLTGFNGSVRLCLLDIFNNQGRVKDLGEKDD